MDSSWRFFLGNSTISWPLGDRGIFSSQFFQHIWRRASVLLCLCLQVRAPAVFRARQQAACPGWGWAPAHTQSTSTFTMGYLWLRAAKKEETIYLHSCKETTHFLFEKGLCLVWAKSRVLSLPSDCQSLSTLQILFLWPPAVQTLLTSS